MLYNKKITILIVALIIFLILLLAINLLRGDETTTQPASDIPVFNGSPNPSASILIPKRPKPVYDTEALHADYIRITGKKELSQEDKTARQKLIDSLQEGSDILYENNNFRVRYLKPSVDSFMVTILNNDIEATKTEISSWFRQQGVSEQGICNLPVVLQLGGKVDEYLRANNQTFNPIPEECK